MTPTAIRAALRDYGPATLAELSHQLGAEPDVVRSGLEFWRRKGRVAVCPLRLGAGGGCAGCTGCDHAPAGPVELYEWRD